MEWCVLSSILRKKGQNNDITKPGRNQTESIEGTLRFILEQLIPDDKSQDDTDHHKRVRKRAKQP